MTRDGAARTRKQCRRDRLRGGQGRDLVAGDGFHEDRFAVHALRCGETRYALNDGVVDALMGGRAFRAEAGDRDIDQIRIEAMQIRIAKATAVERAGPRVLHEHIRAFHNLVQRGPNSGVLEINRH